ncbi:MAG: DUF4476 domain-containing protein [Bacteroidia bacterium]|nr:DUF4476 domain-containing protein [Bacteroidia bacterium]
MKRILTVIVLAFSWFTAELIAQRNPDLAPSPSLQNPVSVTPAIGTTTGVSGINLQQQLQQQQQYNRPISHAPVTNPVYQPLQPNNIRPGNSIHHNHPQIYNPNPPITVPVVIHQPVYIYQPVPTPQFHSFYCSLQNYWTENSRLIVAKQFIDNHYVTTEQVRQIALQFVHDENRLELAMFAYRRVADPYNYFRLMDIFAYANTARRFHDFILANEQYFRPAPCNGSAPAISDTEFGMILQSIRNRTFEETRVLMAKQVITFYSLYSHQISALMQVMSFENSRMEIAKFAANRVIDPHNYYLVNNAFRFESSVQELHRWLYGY